jgi:acyl-CoA synthetase (NDP forming)
MDPTPSELQVFFNPRSVAVIGASERPGSWGSFIMQGLLSRPFPGVIFPVNHQADHVFGIPAHRDVGRIQGPLDLAVITIPGDSVERAVADCGAKGVKGVTIISAGYGEATDRGKEKERELVRIARSYGMRILGPNVSGTFNLHGGFNGSASPEKHLLCTPLGAVCQGGYAFYDLLASGFSKGMGVGKFVHTGNECDLTATDFLEYFGEDPQVHAVLMYLEEIRDAGRFAEQALRVSMKKPIVVYKAGRTPGAARAAQSHTGALSGQASIYRGIFRQSRVLVSPTMELLLPLGHALVERPPLRGPRIAIVTMGGSWGVALADTLEEAGLRVPEFSPNLQKILRSLGMPLRASTRNPVDIGAAGLFFEPDILVSIGREILISGEADALILHGMARVGMQGADAPKRLEIFLEVNKKVIQAYQALEQETGCPVLIGSIFTPFDSQVVCDLTAQGLRVFNRLDETAQVLALLHEYGSKRG